MHGMLMDTRNTNRIQQDYFNFGDVACDENQSICAKAEQDLQLVPQMSLGQQNTGMNQIWHERKWVLF